MVVGGGKFGSKAIEYLLKHSEPFIVIDKNEKCTAARNYDLKKLSIKTVRYPLPKGNYFLVGQAREALILTLRLKPKYIFTTAPIHVAAALIKEKYQLEEWNEGINSILAGIPLKVVVSIGNGTIVVSYNRDGICPPNCNAPSICPITKMKRPCPMYKLLSFAAPNGIVLRSYQLQPGLGALKGREVLETLKRCEGKDKVIVGTACKCHGVITALKSKTF